MGVHLPGAGEQARAMEKQVLVTGKGDGSCPLGIIRATVAADSTDLL